MKVIRSLCIILSFMGTSVGMEQSDFAQEDFFRAVQRGNVDEVRRLFELSRVDLKAMDRYGRTALHVAARGGYADVVKFLVRQGAEVNAQDMWVDTPLHFAAAGGHLDVVDALLTYNASAMIRNSRGDTAFVMAVMGQAKDVAKRLASVSDLTMQYENGDSILEHIIRQADLTREGDVMRRVESISLLCDIQKFDMNLQNIYGQTALHIAIEQRSKDFVETLCWCPRTRVGIRDRKGNTPLDYALFLGDQGGVRTLCNKLSADDLSVEEALNGKNENRRSPLEEVFESRGLTLIKRITFSHCLMQEKLIPHYFSRTLDELIEAARRLVRENSKQKKFFLSKIRSLEEIKEERLEKMQAALQEESSPIIQVSPWDKMVRQEEEAREEAESQESWRRRMQPMIEFFGKPGEVSPKSTQPDPFVFTPYAPSGVDTN